MKRLEVVTSNAENVITKPMYILIFRIGVFVLDDTFKTKGQVRKRDCVVESVHINCAINSLSYRLYEIKIKNLFTNDVYSFFF